MTGSMPEGKPPRAREEVVFRPLSREWVLYDPATSRLHVLNVTAALVWQLCDGETSLDRMVEEVSRVLDAPPEPERVRADVQEVLGRFEREGLLA